MNNWPIVVEALIVVGSANGLSWLGAFYFILFWIFAVTVVMNVVVAVLIDTFVAARKRWNELDSGDQFSLRKSSTLDTPHSNHTNINISLMQKASCEVKKREVRISRFMENIYE